MMGRQTTSTRQHHEHREPILAQAFSRALRAAAEFEGSTAPNPPVGCVLLDANGAELAMAGHRKAGELHAEAAAIRLAHERGVATRIHTVVVTLEPCNHTGRTPPCTEAILSTPARELWIGVKDPNPAVPGQGAGRLKAAGVTVGFVEDLRHADAAKLHAAAQRLNAPFAKRSTTGLPWVTVKQAVARDGSMIPPAGQKTFTSAPSLIVAHQLRKRADAILTGSGTVLADSPEFTVRHVPDFPGKQRRLVILDRRRRVPANYLKAAAQRGFDVRVEDALAGALQALGSHGVLEVLVEAGPTLTRQVLNSGLWDEHYRIEQGAGADGSDRISVHIPAPPQQLP